MEKIKKKKRSHDFHSKSVFAEAIANIKPLLEKNKGKLIKPQPIQPKKQSEKKYINFIEKVEFPDRGVVLLSKIPREFVEYEMLAYFSQFGVVTRMKFVRSPKTGRPMGFAFIEFKYSDVAKVVVETMNSFILRGNRLQAKFIPGEEVTNKIFFDDGYKFGECRKKKQQLMNINKMNKDLTTENMCAIVAKELKSLERKKKFLEKKGLSLNCQIVSHEEAPVSFLEIDESDNEIEYKIHPNVIKIVRPKTQDRLLKSNKSCDQELSGNSEPDKHEDS